MNSSKHIYVIAGPNGAGKTTFANTFLPKYAKCIEFVNADLIARGLSPFGQEKAALPAGKLFLNRIRELAKNNGDFSFETTLSDKTYLPLFNEFSCRGYKIHIFFLWLNSVNLARSRIAERVKKGGHNIPDDIIERRYIAGLLNFFKLYTKHVNSWTLFDNSYSLPLTVADKNERLRILDNEKYSAIIERGRTYENQRYYSFGI